MQVSGDWVEYSSYLASVLVFAAFFMKAIVPLRLVAMASNIAFVAYAAGAGILPILILHAALLPLNIIRISQHISLVRRVREASENEPDIAKLLPLMTRRKFTEGDIIFRQGEEADEMYYLCQGKVEFPEVGAVVSAGEIFGEIALFLQDNRRTASAVCAGPCEVFSLSEKKVQQLVVTDPSFGLFLSKLIAARLQQNNQSLLRQSMPVAVEN
ncbi:cyclic nucleotide-binding domain-containing protein [Actibacterium pelagium]|nr:cyclic nucleotide-binding domain-containing protein [Actibacterium pelagium]